MVARCTPAHLLCKDSKLAVEKHFRIESSKVFGILAARIHVTILTGRAAPRGRDPRASLPRTPTPPQPSPCFASHRAPGARPAPEPPIEVPTLAAPSSGGLQARQTLRSFTFRRFLRRAPNSRRQPSSAQPRGLREGSASPGAAPCPPACSPSPGGEVPVTPVRQPRVPTILGGHLHQPPGRQEPGPLPGAGGCACPAPAPSGTCVGGP